MIEQLKRLCIGVAVLVALSACIAVFGLTWMLCMHWPISAAVVIVVLLCWTIGTVARTMP